ncbi:MAG: valine--tRNA ligase [Nanoarchaeota archaeon]|nr:valine--tRNA ligase [Nanoarchaeota archaeon]
MDLPKNYNPKEEEPAIIKFWLNNQIFKFDKKSQKPIFSIDTPPPTVSGKMHLGHAFMYSQMDFIARYKRMAGFNVFYPFGTDDNGLPTKLLIEKIKNIKGSDLTRKDFTNLCLKTLNEELRPKYIADWKRIGTSCDFELFYTTIDKHCQKISQKSFIDLYKKGREYRTEAAAMFCPKCQTAISQVECEDKEIQSHFNDIVFKVKNKNKEENIIIATTRPELLPACVAIFYYPDDKRYKHLKGKSAKVPLFNFEVPILEDERADPEKGTGIVMCCTFGDLTDTEWQKAHKLPIKEAINKKGEMTGLAGKYKGLSIDKARKQIIGDMKAKGLLLKQKPISHIVNVHERCGTPIEFIHSKQWFIKYLDLKDKMKDWGNSLNWYPKHMKNRYDNWVNGLQWDWCISRQLPFGVPFPVWYCKKCGEVILAKEKDLPVDPTSDKPQIKICPKCNGKEFEPEKDVLNTWATSSLTPQIAAGLVPEMYDKLYPMAIRPQAHDIITFWLFNTVVKSQLHNSINPWRDCVISGWALDPKGKKMSKSKGNIIEPQEMLDKYSADSLRFWAAGSKLGEDLPFQEKDLVTGQKFVTKLWNASKFALMHLEDYDGVKPKKIEAFDKWLLSKLHSIIKISKDSFDNYEYNRTKHETDKFFWQIFCDNYLEIIKDRIYNPEVRGKEARKSAQYTLYQAILTIIKIMGPITPFITEKIYQLYFVNKEKIKSIHLSSWPELNEDNINTDTEEIGDKLVQIISEVRKKKSEANLSLKQPVKELVITLKQKESKEFIEDLKATTKAEKISFDKEFKIKM